MYVTARPLAAHPLAAHPLAAHPLADVSGVGLSIVPLALGGVFLPADDGTCEKLLAREEREAPHRPVGFRP